MNDHYPMFSENDLNGKQENQFIIIVNGSTLKKMLKFVLLGVIIYLFFQILPYIKSLLISLGISFIISFLLYPFVDALENRGINRGPAIVIVFLMIILMIYGGFKFFIPSLTQELKSIAQIIQNENPQSLIEKLQTILSHRIPALKNPEIALSVSTKLHTLLMSLLQKSFNIIMSLLSSFMMIVTIPIVTFFLLKDARKIKKSIIQLVPNRYFEMSLNLIHKSSQKLGSYIRGQLLVSTVIGTLSIIALFLLNIPYFFIIGLVAGLANMIPYFGPWVGALPGVIVALIETGSTNTVASVIIAFAVIQLLDNTLVSPLIVSKSVQIHPLLVILVILVGGSLAGILGMLLAVPTFAVIQVIIKEIVWSFKNYRLTG